MIALRDQGRVAIGMHDQSHPVGLAIPLFLALFR